MLTPLRCTVYGVSIAYFVVALFGSLNDIVTTNVLFKESVAQGFAVGFYVVMGLKFCRAINEEAVGALTDQVLDGGGVRRIALESTRDGYLIRAVIYEVNDDGAVVV